MDLDKIIIEPILTEKSNELREAGKYTFRVDPRANKLQIIEAVRTLFQVHPVSCRTVVVKGKPRRTRYQLGRTSQWKKAVVTLASGEKIGIFEGA